MKKRKTNMADTKCVCSSLRKDGELAQQVRTFQVLYDKAEKGYKERGVEQNAWNEVASNLEFVENGENKVL